MQDDKDTKQKSIVQIEQFHGWNFSAFLHMREQIYMPYSRPSLFIMNKIKPHYVDGKLKF